MLIVADTDGDLRGILRAIDIAGPAPVMVAHDLKQARDDVLVSDIMRPKNGLHALCISDLRTLAVGEIIEALQRLGEPDIVVLDQVEPPCVIRGLLSVSDISRELRIDFDLNSRATTFAELEHALSSH